MKPRNTLPIILLIVCCLIILSIFLIKTKLILKIYNNIVLDNKEHYLSCDELPTADKVKQVMNEHQNTLREIEQINPGHVFVTAGDYENCVDKSDIVISYPSHQNKLEIEKIINGKTFFGVPYKLRNQ
ncbi:MAG: hypothetical protein AAB688_00915 [Patescibacteria group bacterium]